jgi:hypothetical protein
MAGCKLACRACLVMRCVPCGFSLVGSGETVVADEVLVTIIMFLHVLFGLCVWQLSVLQWCAVVVQLNSASASDAAVGEPGAKVFCEW